jgi:putative transposase
MLIHLDNLISKRKSKNKNLIKKKRRQIQNFQKELHFKSAHYICENFKNIYIPKLTKDNDIINKEKRKINTKTVRNMVVLGHCKFIERLKTKANLYTNVKVHIITEEYTSQKCLSCSRLTKTSDEIYRCKHCRFTIDRDFLGSTNILLKNW